ncbi:MAG: rod shape-determining protein MreD [Methyloprofundus sp.]|nr:rod shape-determining protein MreD [Methyloprofundus sp.]
MMLNNRLPLSIYYWSSIFLAMTLSVVYVPDIVKIMMPDWVLVVLIYWTCTVNFRVSVGKAWLVGLLMDALTGQLLGQYAIAYAVSIYLTEKQYKRIKAAPVVQQSLFIAGILFLAKVLFFWVERIEYQSLPGYFWLPVFTGALVWPVIIVLFSKIRFS